MEYDIDKIRTHLCLGIGHLQKAQKNGERVGVLDDLEFVYAGDCLAVALDECRPRQQETIRVRSLNNLVYMGRGMQKENMRDRSKDITVSNITSHDAASKVLPAVSRIDEARQLCKRAEAVWVYAKRSGDSELQNKAAEIRLFARQRAGELLAGIAPHPGSRGQGRPRRDGAKIGSNGAKAYPATLEEIDVIKDQPSKWQQIVRWMNALSSKKLGSTTSLSA
jgi:hypothetical protein